MLLSGLLRPPSPRKPKAHWTARFACVLAARPQEINGNVLILTEPKHTVFFSLRFVPGLESYFGRESQKRHYLASVPTRLCASEGTAFHDLLEANVDGRNNVGVFMYIIYLYSGTSVRDQNAVRVIHDKVLIEHGRGTSLYTTVHSNNAQNFSLAGFFPIFGSRRRQRGNGRCRQQSCLPT